MKNPLHPLTVELLKLIDKEKPSKPTQQNIIQPPSNLFFTIKQMYNSFKKDNESTILQNKVYELKVEQNDQPKETFQPVQIETICEAHSKHNQYQTINNLIQIKDYFTLVNDINDTQRKQKDQEFRKEKEKAFDEKNKYEQHQKWQQLIKWIIQQLIDCIVKQILKINDLQTILQLFTKVLKTKQCILKNSKNDENDKNVKNNRNGKNKLYEKVEKQMMNKILSFNSLFNQTEIKMISDFMIGLPYLDVQALIFISELYDKIQNLNDFNHLKILYTKVYEKVQSSLKQDQNDSKNDPINEKFRDMLKDMLLDSLMKIAIDDHIIQIRKTLQQIDERKKQPISMKDDIEDQKFLKALHKQAINKMQKHIKIARLNQTGSNPTLTYSSQTELNQTINQKQKQVLKFIFCALQSEALFNENSKFKVWHHFIFWYHISTWKQSFSSQITPLVQKILDSPQNALKVMQVLYETEGGQSDKTLSQNIDMSLTIQNLNDSISNFFVRQLLSGLSNYSKYLNNKIAMKLVSLVIMKEKDGLQIYESIVFNHTNLSYIDIIIQCFDIPKVTEFFNRLLNSPQKRTSLQVYLTTLLQQKPNKYKILFSKIDRHNQGEIFQLSQYFLLRFFEQSLIPTDHPDLILSFIRQMASFTPSSYTIQILNRFISKAGEQKRIYYQAARTLNIILCTKQAKDLPFKFKKDLKDIVASKVLAAEHVFINVPKKMNDDLSAFYNPNAPK